LFQSGLKIVTNSPFFQYNLTGSDNKWFGCVISQQLGDQMSGVEANARS